MIRKFVIRGTHCSACKGLIEDISRDITGIASCMVNFESGETIVVHDELVNWEAFKREVETSGDYKVLLN